MRATFLNLLFSMLWTDPFSVNTNVNMEYDEQASLSFKEQRFLIYCKHKTFSCGVSFNYDINTRDIYGNLRIYLLLKHEA